MRRHSAADSRHVKPRTGQRFKLRLSGCESDSQRGKGGKREEPRLQEGTGDILLIDFHQEFFYFLTPLRHMIRARALALA